MQAKAQQTFVPQYKELQAIHIYIASELPEDNAAVLSVTFFDKELQVVSMQELPLTGQAYPGYLRVPTDSIQFVPGDSYYYFTGAMKEPLSLAYTDVAETETTEGLETYYAETLQEGSNLLTVYEYRAPFHWQNALVLALLCLAGSIILTIVSEFFCRYFKIDMRVPLGTLLRTEAAMITGIVSLTAFIAVGPMQMFTKSVIDILFLETGVILFALTCLYLIYGKKSGKQADSISCEQPEISKGTTGTRAEHILSGIDAVTCYLQKVAFAGSVLACCHYGNALSMAGQESASAWIFGCFAVAIVCCFVLAVCRFMLNRERHKRTGIRFSVSYAMLTVFLFILFILYRNERDWVFKAVIPFTLFYIGAVLAGNSKKIMKNLIDGIIISFVLLTGYCLIHRPYHYYRYNRYPMYFHTVTVTGMYLILVISAAFAKFLAAWKQENVHTDRKNIIKHTLMLGVTLSYLFMAVSRIGMVTMLFTFAAVLLLTALTAQDTELALGKKLLFTGRDSLKRFAWIVAGLLWCFPICFAATRILPAVVMQPERTELEEYAVFHYCGNTAGL